ncbi:MAG: hypothetical protein J7M29_00880 [Verrucomicrobia bacterium]|nr:hypothetical protein [Verrucomicrobiota bacterium]
MRRIGRIGLFLLIMAWGLAGAARAEEYRLMDGTHIWGTVSAFDEQGVVFRLDSGGFSDRVSWSKFDQASLKKMAQDSKLKPYAEPFIELPPEVRPKPKKIVVKEVPKVNLPRRASLFSLFSAPIGLFMLGLLYLGNLLAGYEIAIYRERPAGAVCALSALLPVVGPIVFLASPSAEREAPAPSAPAPEAAAAGSAAAATSKKIPTAAGSGLRMARSSQTGKAAGKLEPRVYDRSEFTFDRRFIETTFSGFFRVVPGPDVRDLVLVIKTPKKEVATQRVTRMTGTDMFVQPIGGGAQEVRIRLGEIAQIILRPKDEKGRK